MNTFDDVLTLDFDHFAEQGLGTIRGAAAQMAFAALGANQDARPGQAEPFGGCLVGLQLELAFLLLTCHSELLSTNIAVVCATANYTRKNCLQY